MDDTKIIALYGARDEAALSETALRYGALARQVAMNILHTPSDAEECVNDAYHAVWCAIPPACPASLRAFLCRIVRNLALDRWRAEHAAKRIDGTALMLSELDEAIPAEGSVERTLEGAALSACINGWLKSLPVDDRVLFVRRYFYGEAVADLAARCGRSPNTVSKRLGRLRERLRRHLEKEGYTV